MNSRRVWTEEEDRAIAELVQEHGTKNWATIAVQLAREMEGKPRSGKQCRQRWHNHLDPGIEKRGWSKAEEQRLFQLHKRHGNKWTVIAEQLPGRTDNAIKNYFYSTIRRSLRRIGKFVGSKNSTEQMKKIKPSTLSKIFAAGTELAPQESTTPEEAKLIAYIRQNCESVREEIVQFTNYKPRRRDKAPQEERGRFELVMEKMAHINEAYERIKGEQKLRRYEEEMFQKDYNKLMKSDSSDQPSEEQEKEASASQTPRQNRRNTTARTRSTRANYRKLEKGSSQVKEQVDNLDENNKQANSDPTHIMPTVIIKSQHNLDNQEQGEGGFQNPDFMIELKEDFHTAQPCVHPSNSMRSPGYYFSTPSINPFGYFQSPSTPKNLQACFSSFQGFGVLQNSAIDQFQISIQRQIQCNLGEGQGGEQRRGASSSISTIGSPGSAFRFCGLQ